MTAAVAVQQGLPAIAEECMKKSLTQVIIFFLLFLLLVFSGSGWAFKRETRCQILRDAIHFCPQHLKTYLVKNFEAVHKGIHYVDRTRQTHSVINPEDTAQIYTSLVLSIRNGKLHETNTTHRFGILACYLAETVSPDNFKTSDDLIPQTVRYNGHKTVGDIEGSVARLVSKYREPYRGKNKKKITNYLYWVAVNEIVDHWVSAWVAGGKNPGKMRPKGVKVVHKTVTLEYNYLPA